MKKPWPLGKVHNDFYILYDKNEVTTTIAQFQFMHFFNSSANHPKSNV